MSFHACGMYISQLIPMLLPITEIFDCSYFDFYFCLCLKWASWIAQQVKNSPAMQETQEIWVQSLGQEDPLEEGMATHSSISAWRVPWTEESGGLQFMGSQRVKHD